MIPIGKRIIQIMELLERVGPLGVSRIAAHMPELEASTVAVYCMRARRYGIIAKQGRGIKEGTGYMAPPDWRERVERREAMKPKPRAKKVVKKVAKKVVKKVAKKTVPVNKERSTPEPIVIANIPNSVFDLHRVNASKALYCAG